VPASSKKSRLEADPEAKKRRLASQGSKILSDVSAPFDFAEIQTLDGDIAAALSLKAGEVHRDHPEDTEDIPGKDGEKKIVDEVWFPMRDEIRQRSVDRFLHKHYGDAGVPEEAKKAVDRALRKAGDIRTIK
jgi:hypothetical protein